MSTTAPPGWYPDPWGQSPQRFWDGARWTPQLSGGGVATRARLPEGAPIYGTSIWLLATLPLLSAVSVWLIRIDASSLGDYIGASQAFQSGGSSSGPFFNPYSMLGPGYPVAMLLGLALQVALVLLAYRDHKHLCRLGLQRPFHWGWVFLGAIVYVIGRSVVVRKVAEPRGLAPMWAGIATDAVVLVSLGIWMTTLMGSITRQLPIPFG